MYQFFYHIKERHTKISATVLSPGEKKNCNCKDLVGVVIRAYETQPIFQWAARQTGGKPQHLPSHRAVGSAPDIIG